MITSNIVGTDPLDLSVVKKHLNVDFAEDDTYITSLIGVSLSAVENYCRNSFIERENTQVIGKFTAGELPLLLTTDPTPAPEGVVTVTYSIGTVPTDLEISPLSQYNIDSNYYRYLNGYIVIYLSEVIAVDNNVDVSISWATGMDTIDVSINQARLLLCGTYYENRESAVVGMSVTDLPNGSKYLLEPYMNPQVG